MGLGKTDRDRQRSSGRDGLTIVSENVIDLSGNKVLKAYIFIHLCMHLYAKLPLRTIHF